MAGLAGDPETAHRLIEQSIATYEAEGDTHAAARGAYKLGRAIVFTGRRDEGLARLEHAYEVISGDEPDEDLAMLAAFLGRAYWFSGDLERAAARSEFALDIAEAQGLPEPLAAALRAKAAVLFSRGHREESFGLLKHALEVALEHDLAEHASTCYFLLSDRCFRRDRYAEALGYLDESLALANKMGSRPFEWGVLAERTYALFMSGRWDDVVATADEFTQEQIDAGGVVLGLMQSGVYVHVERGEFDEARRILSLFSRVVGSTDVQDRSTYLAANAALRRAEGRFAEALSDGAATIETAPTLGPDFQGVKHGVVDALEAALALGDSGSAHELLAFIDGMSPGIRPPFLDAQAHRFRARMASDAAGLELAARLFRELEIPFSLGVTLLEHAELTGSETSHAEAREIFQRLGASPWLERASAIAPQDQSQISA
jgi:tetratricopeptide (TPR) repeat protein